MKFKATPDKKCTGFFISCVFLFLLFFVGNLSAQQVQLKGWITDENGVGIPGVTVKEKTSGFAVLSGSDGFFTFLAKERKLILTFQKNGFIMQ